MSMSMTVIDTSVYSLYLQVNYIDVVYDLYLEVTDI